MEVRHATAPDQVPGATTEWLRARFLVEDLFAPGEVRLVYSHEDRMVVGGAVGPARLPSPAPLRADRFLDRRELGVVNVGDGTGTVTVDGAPYELAPKECLYVGRGSREVDFGGGAFSLVSTPAHAAHPTALSTLADAEPVRLGGREGADERTIYKHVHAGGVRSCQLVLGVTVLEPGSMWNTMPCHTHERRTEVYFYFGLPAGQRVIHLMGRPDETRNLVVADRQAVISPPWSVHCGFGTRSYSFVWAMGGENQAYDDMEPVEIGELR
ncbi:5-dehydro-4-deoxy-D-glucuronate isomerase [Planomonospora venezuelensis]|uniref:4-deoxy-L-threo-5-hexosulose-uronate ketol-isomerase n=1 Tax=Planomonospora venezuelensis TaxID=1999 RepID=A0A841D931_PLAVE|nr:5-dehydro-4-deoxy-D-glucuronate isomerase [Planomonospora venezuelensis]MBB5964635.1 4-deoxy-L-threo-5-hexosulose-uronate ketol-isomerase [Planomonospora venezuelensis]GIN04288.1 4-deoxy-L-threo-5-hexosulose-uronate ketol-isomerase [Planomonospora venezuelensis]